MFLQPGSVNKTCSVIIVGSREKAQDVCTCAFQLSLPIPTAGTVAVTGLTQCWALGLVCLGKRAPVQWNVKVSLTGSWGLRSSGWKFQVTDRRWLIGLLLEKVHFNLRLVPFTAFTSLEVWTSTAAAGHSAVGRTARVRGKENSCLGVSSSLCLICI